MCLDCNAENIKMAWNIILIFRLKFAQIKTSVYDFLALGVKVEDWLLLRKNLKSSEKPEM